MGGCQSSDSNTNNIIGIASLEEVEVVKIGAGSVDGRPAQRTAGLPGRLVQYSQIHRPGDRSVYCLANGLAHQPPGTCGSHRARHLATHRLKVEPRFDVRVYGGHALVRFHWF